MDKLTFPIVEYLYALSCLKNGFCASQTNDEMSPDARTTLMNRIYELEISLLQQLPPQQLQVTGELPFLGQVAQD